ncbi:MAG: UDP-glucose 4-epimerase GalE [Lysobacterales bacterium]
MSKKVLVTGGAGYIGSHVARQLGERGEQVVVLDNLSTGFEHAVLFGELITGDAGDMDLVSNIFAQHDIDTVMHFAARTIVPESVEDPLRYYQNNTMQTRNLIQSCVDHGVQQLVFSSTAAVYGMPPGGEAGEDTPTQPINPYGTSKLMSEWMLRDVAATGKLRSVVLRYFNVAGCDPQGRIGQNTPKATLLIKVLAELAMGKRSEVKLFGTDYDTRDGTCIRDYIHVEDLADAHLRALDYLRDGGGSEVMNCGYGEGFTVREVITAVERSLGTELAIVEVDRRPGDPPELIARSERIQQVLGWTPRYNDLKVIVDSALGWEKKLAEQGNG